jgi:effector-binding domain-containing protein
MTAGETGRSARLSEHRRSFAGRGVQPQMLPGGFAARAVHRSDYATVGATYDLLENWIAENGYVVTGQPWEGYLDDPDTPEPRTQVYLPCAPAPKE